MTYLPTAVQVAHCFDHCNENLYTTNGTYIASTFLSY